MFYLLGVREFEVDDVGPMAIVDKLSRADRFRIASRKAMVKNQRRRNAKAARATQESQDLQRTHQNRREYWADFQIAEAAFEYDSDEVRWAQAYLSAKRVHDERPDLDFDHIYTACLRAYGLPVEDEPEDSDDEDFAEVAGMTVIPPRSFNGKGYSVGTFPA